MMAAPTPLGPWNAVSSDSGNYVVVMDTRVYTSPQNKEAQNYEAQDNEAQNNEADAQGLRKKASVSLEQYMQVVNTDEEVAPPMCGQMMPPWLRPPGERNTNVTLNKSMMHTNAQPAPLHSRRSSLTLYLTWCWGTDTPDLKEQMPTYRPLAIQSAKSCLPQGELPNFLIKDHCHPALALLHNIHINFSDQF